VTDAGNTEQSKGRIKGNRKDAGEHGTESSKVARGNHVAGVCGPVFSVMCEGIM